MVDSQGAISHEDSTSWRSPRRSASSIRPPRWQLVFGTGPRRRDRRAGVGGDLPRGVLHELAHVLTPGAGHGKAWRYAARQVGLLRPRAWPDLGELASWEEIAPALRRRLQGIPAPTERAPAHFDDWHRRRCGVGYGSRGGTSRGEGAGSRYLKVTCQHPGCGYQVRLTRKWLAPFGSDHGHRPGPTLSAAGHCLRIPTEAIAY